MNKPFKYLTLGFWLLVLSSSLYFASAQTWQYSKKNFELLDSPPLTDLDTRVLNLMTLNHRGLYDDFIYLWTLQTLIDPRLKLYSPEQVQATLLKVTRHLPKIETLYMLSCFVLAFDFKHPQLCERLTLDGLKAVPDGWRVPLTQGFLYSYLLNDLPNAAMYYGLAASRAGSPEFLKPLARKMIEENSLSISELQTTLEHLLEGSKNQTSRKPSRFGSFLETLSAPKGS